MTFDGRGSGVVTGTWTAAGRFCFAIGKENLSVSRV